MCAKGIKQVGSVWNVTMIVDINAIGSHIRPVLIFPRVNFKIDVFAGDSTVSIGALNPAGWSNQRFVFDYLKHFYRM